MVIVINFLKWVGTYDTYTEIWKIIKFLICLVSNFNNKYQQSGPQTMRTLDSNTIILCV